MRQNSETPYTLVNNHKINHKILDDLLNGDDKGITTAILDDFCRILNCRVDDIIEYVKDDGLSNFASPLTDTSPK